MSKQSPRWAVLLLLILVSLTGSLAAAGQSGKTVVGKVTSFDRETLAVKTDASQTVTFVLGPETQYVKWVTQKPLQRSTVADWTFLGVGKRVAVQPAGGERPTLARIVRIATE